ncbi:MAG: phosphotransferase family protein [Oscillospiraceae bacterium]
MKPEIIASRPGKTIYRKGGQVVKVFDEKFSKADILNEALNLARVEETRLPIPKVSEVSKADGRWAIHYDFIEGVPLSGLMQDDPAKLEEYLNRFVDIQLDMHTRTVPLLTKLWDKMHRKIDQTQLDEATRYELHTRLASMPKHHKLCHGDFNPSNIIITPENQAYILDWSHATQGNASADAARTYLLFHLQGDIPTAGRYLELFCEKSGTDKSYVQSWLPIVAASQSVKGKPEEKEFLSRWIHVMDYE